MAARRRGAGRDDALPLLGRARPARGLTERLLAAVDAQLAARGLVLKRGTLIDASLVEADADVRKGPDGGPVTVEREAGFAKRRGKAFFGFKAHLAVDEGSGLVRRAILTPAQSHPRSTVRRPSGSGARERASPVPRDVIVEGRDLPRIGRHGVVREVAAHHLAQPAALFGHRHVAHPVQRLLDLHEVGSHPLGVGIPCQSLPQSLHWRLQACPREAPRAERRAAAPSAAAIPAGTSCSESRTASMSASIAQTWINLPAACRTGDSAMTGPTNMSPVSSENSRCAASRRSSSRSTSPLATDQACVSLFTQNGPPGCTRKTSNRPSSRRYGSRPALVFGIETPNPRHRTSAEPCSHG